MNTEPDHKPDNPDTPDSCLDNEGTGDSVPLPPSDSDGPGAESEFQTYCEFRGALVEAEQNPSRRALSIMAQLAIFYSGLPHWRQDQLAKAGYKGDTNQPAKLRVLLDLCLNLSAIKASGAFALGYLEAARAIRTSKSFAWAWLHLLESAGVLRCVQRGSWQRRLSSVYEFAPSIADGGDGGQLPF